MKKGIVKVVIAGIFSILLFLGAGAGEVSAEEIQDTLELIQEGYFPDPIVLDDGGITEDGAGQGGIQLYNAGGATIYSTVYNGLSNSQANIDVSSYGMSIAAIKEVLQFTMDNYPEFFYVSGTYSYSTGGDGNVAELHMSYKVSGSTLAQQKQFYNDQINYIAGLVNPGWSDEQKVLFINDYLAQNYRYDDALTIYDAYNFLYRKTGVCQSYTLVFSGLMRKLGLNASYASSKSMNHIWNIVEVDGKWYHVDVTWNDPTKPDVLGRAMHDNLLRSDTGISSTGHSGWVKPNSYSCANTKYDSYFWQDSSSPFQCINGVWYYTIYNSFKLRGELYSRNFSNNTSTLLKDLGQWYVYGDMSTFYSLCNSGLDVYANELYYNTYDSIYKYNPSTGVTSLVYKPTGIAGYIHGMRMNGNTISYYYTNKPSVAGNVLTYTVAAVAGAEEASHEAPSRKVPYTAVTDDRDMWWFMFGISIIGLSCVWVRRYRRSQKQMME